MIANENRSELLQSLKEGSFSAFEKLYNLYSGKLYNFIMRLSSGNQYMAEEVVIIIALEQYFLTEFIS